MPVSNNIETHTRRVNFNIKGKSTTLVDTQKENQFLTIVPALPILPGAPIPPKLLKHPYNSLCYKGSSFNVEHAEVEGCDVVTLQWTSEGKTIMATRTTEEREKNPDRICLNRRGLTVFPNIIGETKLRLMSLQHNLLTKIEGCNFLQLTKLVFLDLYDNQIEKICNLEPLENLRVLLIGKNKIKKITGLKQLSKLEVLDLHGNQILQVTGLEGLLSLKVLNLAGNNIKTIGYNDFQGLTSLKELNLRRNKIKKLLGFGETPQLQKLYVSNNDIQKIEDMGSLAKAFHIKEISIDGNPVTLNSDYVSFLVSYLPKLQILSSMQISEQVRRTAIAWRTTKEQSNSAFLDLSAEVCINVQREEVISNAKTNWEILRSKTKCVANDDWKINNVKMNNINNIQNVSKFDTARSKSLDRTKSKRFGSLTSIHENVEAKKIQIKRRSNSSDNLFKLENASKVYSLEFKLPPILGPIVDNLMHNKFNENLLKHNNSTTKVNDFISVAYSESESSESHESLKSGLRSYLLNSSGRTSSIESDKQFSYDTFDITNSTSSFTVKTDEKYNLNKIPASKTYKAKKAFQCQNLLISNGEGTSNRVLPKHIFYHQDSESDNQSKSHLTYTEYCSSSLKSSNLDSAKSLISNSSSSSLFKNTTHKSKNIEKDKIRVKSAQARKGMYYKSNRAATARAKCKLAAPLSPVAQIPPKEREQGGDYLIEIVGRCLNIYGQSALRFIDRAWDSSKTEDVNIVKFNYVQFNSIATVLSKLKNKFANIEHFVFKETNICYLGQINAFAEVQGLTSIQIDAEGNPIVSKDWRVYAVFRLAHWGLKIINGKEITEEEIEYADQEYAGLIDIVICSLPDSLLQPLLQKLCLEAVQKQNGEQITAKQFLFNSDPALRSVVGKEALQWRKGNVTQEDLIWRHKGKVYLLNLINFTINAIEKLQIFEKEWPSVLYEIIHKTLSDFSEMDTYMKRCSKIFEND